jgi:hypothetical protein
MTPYRRRNVASWARGGSRIQLLATPSLISSLALTPPEVAFKVQVDFCRIYEGKAPPPGVLASSTSSGTKDPMARLELTAAEVERLSAFEW